MRKLRNRRGKGTSTSPPRRSRSSRARLRQHPQGEDNTQLRVGPRPSCEAVAKDSDRNSVVLYTESSVEVLYISDENTGKDPKIGITIKDDGRWLRFFRFKTLVEDFSRAQKSKKNQQKRPMHPTVRVSTHEITIRLYAGERPMHPADELS
ncbi:50S ribosomal protein L24 [Striga asiatica]|uniref:50S ribosomal protein L24 n=1 Tax=Striga asiatica TaxID=4170 RepID=A0A5A7QG71_STRAF|nr:50S ribosomal protein L24 [Striga asiatica]